jgi:hypothetical protein
MTSPTSIQALLWQNVTTAKLRLADVLRHLLRVVTSYLIARSGIRKNFEAATCSFFLHKLRLLLQLWFRYREYPGIPSP